jgi:transcriptional regulator with XRE-family HTH domain
MRLEINQTQFGALAGVGLKAEQHYEMGRRAPSAAYLARLAAAGVDVLYVLTGVRLPDIWRDQIAAAQGEPVGDRPAGPPACAVTGTADRAPERGDLSTDERQLLALFRRADLSTKMRAVAALQDL